MLVFDERDADALEALAQALGTAPAGPLALAPLAKPETAADPARLATAA